ncbi:MAG: type IV pilus assembly protein PilM [Candidatus Pacebacteria bacterium]|nr:type IV pilus assembly protein PilM [Candidatus Paceibacterota bacterium]
MSFLSSKIEAFGMDFSESSLKIAFLRPKGRRLSLVCFSETEVPPGVITGGEVQDEKQLAQVIRKAVANLRGKGLRTKYVVSSLPEEKSFLDVLSLPALYGRELESAIIFETENHIPVPLANVYFDFEKKEIMNGASKHQEVMIVATPKKVVDLYLSAIKLAGLFPVAMEIESLAVARALVKCREDSAPLLIVDFGENRTSFIIYAGQMIRFTSTFPISSRQITEAIANYLKIPIAEAGQLKRSEGLDGSDKLLRAVTPILNELVTQVKSHLEYFYSRDKNVPSSKVKVAELLLCGGGANLRGLVDFIAKGLDTKVDLGNPWVNILSYPLKEVPILSFSDSLKYTTALGLALRGACSETEK